MRRAVLLCSILSLTPLICAAQNGPLPPFDANFPRSRGAVPGLQWEYMEPPMSMQIPDRRTNLPRIILVPPYSNVGTTGYDCVYLGFNERGSWLYVASTGHVLLWNGTKVEAEAGGFESVPRDALAKLKASALTPQRMAAAKLPAPPNAEEDPNFPRPAGVNERFEWVYPDDSTVPLVYSASFHFPYDYYGFNDQGSVLAEHGIYAHNILQWNAATHARDYIHALPARWNTEIASNLKNSTVGKITVSVVPERTRGRAQNPPRPPAR